MLYFSLASGLESGSALNARDSRHRPEHIASRALSKKKSGRHIIVIDQDTVNAALAWRNQDQARSEASEGLGPIE